MNILHIGNHLGDLSTIEDLIKEINISHFIITLSDGEKAIKVLSELKRAKITSFFDLIFLDLELPDMDGLTCLSFIQKDIVLRTIPVVIISEEPVDKMRCIDLGVIACIEKDFELAHVETIVKNVISSIERQLKKQ